MRFSTISWHLNSYAAELAASKASTRTVLQGPSFVLVPLLAGPRVLTLYLLHLCFKIVKSAL